MMAPPVPPVPDGTRHGRLRLLATTDLHMQLMSYDYCADLPLADHGLARLATMIRRLRIGPGLTLLMDNGDFLQGNPLGDYLVGAGQTGSLHPAIGAMNLLGYDAATLGNHDFNYGLDYLLTVLGQARFAHVCSNLSLALPQAVLHRHLILRRDLAMTDGGRASLRIGVMGLLPPQTMDWDRAHLDGVATITDICDTAAETAQALRAAGADLVIALCHSGIGPIAPAPRMEHAAGALPAVAGIDAMIAGHSHLVFPSALYRAGARIDPVAGTVHGVPTVQPGHDGSHLGMIDLDLACDPGGHWRVDSHRARSLAIPIDCPADPEVVAAVTPAHDATLARLRAPVGRTNRPLTTYFAMVAPEPALGLLAEAHRWHIRALLAETTFDGLPVLAAVSPFKAGGRGGPRYYTDVAAGPLTLRSLADLYAYPNRVQAVAVSGAELEEWLERSASAFCRIAPGQPDQRLLDPDFPAYEFDVIGGVSYAFDLTQPARYDASGRLVNGSARRLRDLAHDGRPVSPEDRFVIATSDFRAATRGFARDRHVIDRPAPAHDVLRHYVQAQDSLSPAAPDWRILPVPGASVVFDTGPAALDHLDHARRHGLEPTGPAPGGFTRFRLMLDAAR
ncbi:bifunctional 2',3'-cyclic-nucleotide 2'-phosphodiesterase/3'-nucleotidase [Paracoccus sp. p3-h83]|uniref:bifunctional 2',3'-cyclic-nucleotide 2'-phosphodiesterase/3'-nucleotidase n=1 Tax=Paracoccus sp. p3-h83 TaxID=3342805 RepID=UPI0035B897E2